MEDWMKNFPSAIVNRTYKGDRDYAQKFYGDGNVLLFQLKNLMTFNKLGQLSMTRMFTDGTVITARSVFGIDYINIDVSRATPAGIASCTITLIDFPSTVPPTKLTGEIGEGDEEGVSYFKTYYNTDVSCSGCEDAVFSFSCVESYSLSPPCVAEIIDTDRDIEGDYIIWRAHTETDSLSATGLGTSLLTAEIKKVGEVICSASAQFDIDCCEKDEDARAVELWWAKVPNGGGESIEYEGMTLYAVPSDIHLVDLSTYPLYAIPEEKGGCIPFTWTLTGPGSLTEAEMGTYAIYNNPESTGESVCEDISIVLRDRCGTLAQVDVIPCCEDTEVATLSIDYDSLTMLCSQMQYLNAVGGCFPFTWEIVTGGGTIDYAEATSRSATYTAPDSNPNCANNPTIRVTDCCGNTDEITVAITNSEGPAYVQYFWHNMGSGTMFPCGTYSTCVLESKYWGCDGEEYDPSWRWGYDCFHLGYGFYMEWLGYPCGGCPDAGGSFEYCSSILGCQTIDTIDSICQWDPDWYGWPPVPPVAVSMIPPADGDLIDLRTAEMIVDGCCPINPGTGLPF